MTGTGQLPTLVTYNQSEVARWCGVHTSTVIAWMKRDDYPQPDVEIRGQRSTHRGWLPSRKQEWRQYAAVRAESPGARLVSMRKDRRT